MKAPAARQVVPSLVQGQLQLGSSVEGLEPPDLTF
jgi:hypothetical protein